MINATKGNNLLNKILKFNSTVEFFLKEPIIGVPSVMLTEPGHDIFT